MGWSALNLLPVKEWLAIWHMYRTPILMGLLATLLILRIWMHLTFTRTHGPENSVFVKGVQSPSVPVKPADNKIEVSLADSEKEKPKRKTPPRRVDGRSTRVHGGPESKDDEDADCKVQILVFFFSLTGSTEKRARWLVEQLKLESAPEPEGSKLLPPGLLDLSSVDLDEYFISPPKPSNPQEKVKYVYLIILPTYDLDTILNTYLEHLRETHHDFRIDTAPLSSLLGYAVFGFGDRETWPTEEEGFCSQAREVDRWMAKLTGRKRAFPLGMGDVKTDAAERLAEWALGVNETVTELIDCGSLGEGVRGSGDPVESDEEDADEVNEESDATRAPSTTTKPFASRVDDVEDLGRTLTSSSEAAAPNASSMGVIAVDFTTYGQTNAPAAQPIREMVPKSSPTYATLTKQGYTIVGSHSGVKICRWTKSALRGRGSCYKYSFYGIKSHLCMETTPSLSCSNKCVFCWRHGTNPVGTTWRWKVDPPKLIFDGVKEGHYKKIRMMKGVPGVRADRFAEAFRIRHCALSLVGEPIFYPHINEFTAMLHREHISSFLVCNAQHPDQLATLQPVTQLYVSIDASNRESLRKIDRPLHRDFWERFQRCLDLLREKRFQQRTVFRLTLVKGFNMADEVEGYATLVERGLPCFVEVKGVTYCGTSTSAGAGLTMQNVPFYDEVRAFVLALNDALAARGLHYGLAAEHAHSCCILLASTRFRIDGRWHTLIDYARFFECLESGRGFTPEDYVGPPTPEWALWGNGGFDPADTRVYRKGKNKKPLLQGDGGGADEYGEKGTVDEEAVIEESAVPVPIDET
ncbi:MAG: hypothetical protein M1838_000388 [Thelocarpon superellum]|nr:MAG: hypothetical protein M1838_000388 [Thelocarpon superellum]